MWNFRSLFLISKRQCVWSVWESHAFMRPTISSGSIRTRIRPFCSTNKHPWLSNCHISWNHITQNWVIWNLHKSVAIFFLFFTSNRFCNTSIKRHYAWSAPTCWLSSRASKTPVRHSRCPCGFSASRLPTVEAHIRQLLRISRKSRDAQEQSAAQ